MYIITVNHHIAEGWYFADGVVLSTNATYATKFLLDVSYTQHSQSIAEMNKVVNRIIPMMLRRSGVSSIPLLLHLSQYTWLVVSYTNLIPYLYLGVISSPFFC